MQEERSAVITAKEFGEELHELHSAGLTLLMPVGALSRRISIASIHLHNSVAALHTDFGEVITFTVSDTPEIRRISGTQDGRAVTRYELTYPLGDYFALVASRPI